MRDFVNNPYSPDERRVVDWIIEHTKGAVGGGEDPIGFILAAHLDVIMERKALRAFVSVAKKVCGHNNCNCPGAKQVTEAMKKL